MPETQLRRLLEANRLAVEHLDLPAALRQIVEAARELAGAEFGAIGVLGANGRLEEFIHVGMDADTVARIGSAPVGLGLLGALIEDPRPVRLADLGSDPRSVGCPLHHPVMRSFLGVPLVVRDEIFGHLYLADPRYDAFGVDDQVLVEALAATAGVAISHAGLFQETKRREQWTAATSRITHELLTNDEVDAMQLVADTVLGLAEADLVAVVLSAGQPHDTELIVDRAAGAQRSLMLGEPLPPDTLIHQCLESRSPQMVDSLAVDALSTILAPLLLGPAMAVPLPAEVGVRGGLFVLRREGSTTFSEFDLDVVASLAGQAALALDRADARLARARTATLEDRDRIARDLHDHVVQRLFATGLNIQSVCAILGPGVSSDRLNDQVDEIDATIRQIRSTIFGLHAARGRPMGARTMILEAITAATATLPGPPEVSFRGPIDLLVTESLRDDVVAVVREALTNVGRHAAAERVEVLVSASARTVEVEVLDDGKGVVEGTVLSGLSNLLARAQALGGTFQIEGRSGPGTRLKWTVPLAAAAS
ncbi:MAG: GAF domain-containing protein [Nocardioides sp.]